MTAATMVPARERAAVPVPMLEQRELARLALWMALATGLAEAAFWAAKRHLLAEFIGQGPDYIWMAPVAQMAVFALPFTLLALVARRHGHRLPLAAAVAVLSFVGWLNLTLLYPRLHLAAYLLLAGGLASASGRLAAAHPHRARRLVRHSLPWLLAAVLLTAAGREASRQWRELRSEASLADAPAGARNVLLIVLDTVRADALGLYGHPGSTSPRLDALGNRGLVFERAISTAPWTLPAHGSLFTGRLPHELSADWGSPISDTWPTLAEWLSKLGYRTGGFVANTRYCSRETGLARGFVHYDDYGHSWAEFALCTGLGRWLLMSEVPSRCGHADWPARKRADEVNADFLAWHAAGQGRPFFAFLNYWDAHDPYVAPPPFDQHRPRTPDDRRAIRHWWWLDKLDLPGSQVQLARQGYEDCIRYLDRQLGSLFDELERRGALDETLVIITSDHGEQFGEHELFSHGNSLYQPVLHVPLLILRPAASRTSGRIGRAVSLRDVPATIAGELGLSGKSPFPGQSLFSLSARGLVARPVVSEIATPSKHPPDHGRSPVARGPMQSIVLGRYKYIRTGDGHEELYNLDRDPHERNNLSGASIFRPLLHRLRRALEAEVERSPPVAPSLP